MRHAKALNATSGPIPVTSPIRTPIRSEVAMGKAPEGSLEFQGRLAPAAFELQVGVPLDVTPDVNAPVTIEFIVQSHLSEGSYTPVIPRHESGHGCGRRHPAWPIQIGLRELQVRRGIDRRHAQADPNQEVLAEGHLHPRPNPHGVQVRIQCRIQGRTAIRLHTRGTQRLQIDH
ncbi:hypothetical protein DAPPUDRAFT_339624 [Daphnia pulex]|uniref:Uncharacterized protein n=1 Tax=Daphnia pulex TaxID=6669 RepID=E9I3J8_DAPPU|nr:hypothetical protein DAPPUDRAFT_339624 [Daphnia pulex]|eukprot:EFX61431.1 hypothetical protein DAPPUDRAFT_339624 [Daphnia pulex]